MTYNAKTTGKGQRCKPTNNSRMTKHTNDKIAEGMRKRLNDKNSPLRL